MKEYIFNYLILLDICKYKVNKCQQLCLKQILFPEQTNSILLLKITLNLIQTYRNTFKIIFV